MWEHPQQHGQSRDPGQAVELSGGTTATAAAPQPPPPCLWQCWEVQHKKCRERKKQKFPRDSCLVSVFPPSSLQQGRWGRAEPEAAVTNPSQPCPPCEAHLLVFSSLSRDGNIHGWWATCLGKGTTNTRGCGGEELCGGQGTAAQPR